MHWVCILSVGDLPLLDSRPELFANKLYADYSRIALQCLTERLDNRTRDELSGKRHFNASYYHSLPFVINMVREQSEFQRATGEWTGETVDGSFGVVIRLLKYTLFMCVLFAGIAYLRTYIHKRRRGRVV